MLPLNIKNSIVWYVLRIAVVCLLDMAEAKAEAKAEAERQVPGGRRRLCHGSRACATFCAGVGCKDS